MDLYLAFGLIIILSINRNYQFSIIMCTFLLVNEDNWKAIHRVTALIIQHEIKISVYIVNSSIIRID